MSFMINTFGKNYNIAHNSNRLGLSAWQFINRRCYFKTFSNVCILRNKRHMQRRFFVHCVLERHITVMYILFYSNVQLPLTYVYYCIK